MIQVLRQEGGLERVRIALRPVWCRRLWRGGGFQVGGRSYFLKSYSWEIGQADFPIGWHGGGIVRGDAGFQDETAIRHGGLLGFLPILSPERETD
jgi:hypothetical protein